MVSLLQIHLHIYVLQKNTLQLYFWYSKLVYLKFAKLEQLILYLMHFNCAEVALKIMDYETGSARMLVSGFGPTKIHNTLTSNVFWCLNDRWMNS